MKILHISSPITWRGGEQQVAYLVNELLQFDTEQWVLSPNRSALASYGENQGWNMLGYKKSGGIDLGLARQITRICKEKGIQIIHCHDAHAHAGAVLAAALFGNKTPVVLSRRVDFPIGSSWFSRWKYNHKCIHAILCVSNTIQKIIEPAIHNKNILLSTVHSGIDLERISKGVPGKLRKEFNLPPDGQIVANVAALADHKDYFTFIDTALQFIEDKNKWFVVLGDGPMRDEIHKYAADNIAGNVIFTGFRNDLDELWPDIDLFLFTSKTEGLGTSILDAMAHRIPVVCTNAGGIPEMVTHDVSGYMADIGDSKELAKGVSKVLSDVSYRNKLVDGAMDVVRKFNKSNTAKKTFDIYRNVLHQKM